MLYRSRTAFRLPYGDGFVESMAPDQMVEVPAELVDRLVAEGHIESIPPARLTETITTPATVTAPVPELLHPESLHARLVRIEEWLWPPETSADVMVRDLEAQRIAGAPLSAEQAARRDDLASRDVTLTPDERTELALLRSHDPAGRAQPLLSEDEARRRDELAAMPARTPEEDAELARLQDIPVAEPRPEPTLA